MSKFVVLIDGTGPYDGNQYERDFKYSFLKQINSKLGDAQSVYYQGPGTLGLTTRSRANNAYFKLLEKMKQTPRTKFYIAGYSRGGAAAMELSKMCAYGSDPDPETGVQLSTDRVPIEALFLLDPVSKDIFCTGGGIPDVVKTAYCMYRDQTIWEYSPRLKTADFDAKTDKVLAVLFNATGQNDPDRYARKFMENAPYTRAPHNQRTTLRPGITIRDASHGAIGGLPWVERRASEQQAVNDAASLLNGWLNEQNVGVQVRDNSFTTENYAKFPEVTQEAVRRAEAELARGRVERMRQSEMVRRSKW